MIILGINAFHGDASAALLVAGELVAAAEEERFTRVKHWAGFPARSINYCLNAAGIGIGDVDHVAISSNPRAQLGRKAFFAIRQRMPLSAVADRVKRLRKSAGLRDHLAAAVECPQAEIRARIHNVEHHDAHIAGGYFVSHFDDASVLSIDGMGDYTSTVTAIAEDNRYRKLDTVLFPHSLGYLYNVVTIFLGFPHYGDEYKVMGLAPFGKPEFINEFRQVIKPYGRTFRLNLDYFMHPSIGVSMSWDGGTPSVDAFHSKQLEQLLGPACEPREPITDRHEDIAASLQKVTEEIIFHLLNELHKRTNNDRLVIVGGCAMNSVAVGKITRNTPFTDVYVPAGAADNGTAIGAAFYVQHVRLQQPRKFQLRHASWGSEIADAHCLAAAQCAELTYQVLKTQELLDYVVEAIVSGKVVGWFQGRMEFGARALGNRSLLADPRRADMREIINLKIKFRERFRPFAPSILAEYVQDYFEIDEPSPFMERVLPIRSDKYDVIPAVTHVDGSGRLQTVTKESNRLYWDLIDRFRQRTGVPMLLNTSLNENEPIVRTPFEAIECFLRTSMDALVIGNVVIDRTQFNGRPCEIAKRAMKSVDAGPDSIRPKQC